MIRRVNAEMQICRLQRKIRTLESCHPAVATLVLQRGRPKSRWAKNIKRRDMLMSRNRNRWQVQGKAYVSKWINLQEESIVRIFCFLIFSLKFVVFSCYSLTYVSIILLIHIKHMGHFIIRISVV